MHTCSYLRLKEELAFVLFKISEMGVAELVNTNASNM